MVDKESPINIALRNFEAAEANLEKLERLFKEIRKLQPDGIAFGNDPQYDELCRDYKDILDELPKIDDWKPEKILSDLNTIAQWRLDGQEIGEVELIISLEEELEAPRRELAEYRHRLNKKRRHLIRKSLSNLIELVGEVLRELRTNIVDDEPIQMKVKNRILEKLRGLIEEIDILLGSSLQRPNGWNNLRRHLAFGEFCDLRDILGHDWPKIKPELIAGLYDENEPIPVQVDDLGKLADSQPVGRIATKLKWDTLTPEDFERLLFMLLSGTGGYENPEWLMKTNAPDRGRDLSVTRIIEDKLSGTRRYRVIIQCKHWHTKSVNVADISSLKEQMKLWDSPRVDVLVIATSGRFTSDAVKWIEKHNNEDNALRIEMWPESHLERLLAERPSLIAEFRLR